MKKSKNTKMITVVMLMLCLSLLLAGCSDKKIEQSESQVPVQEAAQVLAESSVQAESSVSEEESSLNAQKELVVNYQERILDLSKKVIEMDTDVNNAVQDIQTAYGARDQEAYKTALDALSGLCEQLKSAYTAMADEPAPEALTEQQAQLKTAVDNMNEMLDVSMDVYQLAYKGLSETLSEEEVATMTENQTRLNELSAGTTELRDALDAILYFGEDSAE